MKSNLTKKRNKLSADQERKRKMEKEYIATSGTGETVAFKSDDPYNWIVNHLDCSEAWYYTEVE